MPAPAGGVYGNHVLENKMNAAERTAMGRSAILTVAMRSVLSNLLASALQLLKPEVKPSVVEPVHTQQSEISGRPHKPFQLPEWYEAGDFEDEPVMRDGVR